MPGASRCSCPMNDSMVEGRMRSASGAADDASVMIARTKGNVYKIVYCNALLCKQLPVGKNVLGLAAAAAGLGCLKQAVGHLALACAGF